MKLCLHLQSVLWAAYLREVADEPEKERGYIQANPQLIKDIMRGVLPS